VATDPDDYSACDPVLLAAARQHIQQHVCQRGLRHTHDALEPTHPCGGTLRLGPLGKRVIYRHGGHWIAALQCVERRHGQVLDLGPVSR
jgi:hypothetical protein